MASKHILGIDLFRLESVEELLVVSPLVTHSPSMSTVENTLSLELAAKEHSPPLLCSFCLASRSHLPFEDVMTGPDGVHVVE